MHVMGSIALLGLLGLLGGRPAIAQDTQQTCSGSLPSDASETMRDPRMPPSTTGPTEIRAGIFVEDLRDINAVQSSYHFRGVVTVSWCDPRLAFDPDDEGIPERVYFGPEAEAQSEKIWTARGFPVNQVDELQITERAIRIRNDGTVSADLNVSVRLATNYDLRRFPFDRQQLTLELESFAWNEDELVFVADATSTGFDDDFDIPEWTITGVRAHEERAIVIRSAKPFSRLVLTIDIERKSGFYLWKVLLPLLIIVALSWSIFWMVDERFGIRVRSSSTGILTIVAYQFVVSQDLPRIGYLTMMDKIMIVSFMMLAITVLESYLVSRYVEGDHDQAVRIDHTARWLFPLAYAALIGVIALSR